MPYVGEIRLFAGSFAPTGWMFCDARELPIGENQVLFTYIATTYGGDGETYFNLPDLRGRLPVHKGNGFQIGVPGGVEEVTLTVNQIPSHSHPLLASTSGGTGNSAQNAVPAGSPTIDLYRETTPSAPLSPNVAAPSGGSQPHTNFQPYLCLNFIISLFGVVPSQT